MWVILIYRRIRSLGKSLHFQKSLLLPEKTSSRDTFDNNAQFIMSFLPISSAKLSVCRDYMLTSGVTLSSMVTMVLMVTITFQPCNLNLLMQTELFPLLGDTADKLSTVGSFEKQFTLCSIDTLQLS